MIVLLHVLIALSSLAFTSYLYFSPSRNKLRVGYILVATTLASGTYLVLSTHSNMLQSCLTGLICLAIAFTGIIAAQHKLSTVKEDKTTD
jgi:hypothetical protein